MAMTRAIELVTEIPGPRSREIGERIERAVARPLAITFPIVAASGRGATLTDVDGNTFIDFAGGVGCLNVGHSHPDVVAAAHEQLDRFSHTDFTVVPYEIYVALRRAPRRARADLRPGQGGVLQRRHRGGRERRQVRARLHRTPSGDRVRGRLPRPHAALALAHLEGRIPTRPASARSPPRSTASRSRTPTAASRSRTRSARSSALLTTQGRRRDGRRDRARAGAGRGRLHRRAARVRRRCAPHLRPRTGSCSSPTRCRPASAAPAASSRSSTTGVEPDLICVAKSIANGLPLSGVARPGGDHGRARRPVGSAARTSATRSRWRPPSPSST